MVKRKILFIEIYGLDNISDYDIYNVLHKNYPQSFIKIHSAKNITYKDV